MTQSVNVPGVGTLNFPDGMSQQDMATAIKTHFPQVHNQTVQTPEEPSLLSKLASGANAAVSATMFPGASAISSLAQKLPQSSNPAIAWLQNKIAQGPLSNIGEATNAVSSIPTQVLTNKVNDINRIQASPLFGKRPADYGAQSNAALQAGADVVGGLAPMLLTPEAEAPKAAALLEKTPFQLARESGYSIMPSEAAIKGGNAVGGKVIEGLAGSAKTGVDATVKNQAVTNRLASQELNSPVETPLTPTVIDNLKRPHNAVFGEVEGLSKQVGKIPQDGPLVSDIQGVINPEANDFGTNPKIQALVQKYTAPQEFSTASLLKEVRDLRKNATSNYKASMAYQAENAPELGDLADAQQGIADALENRLDRFVQNIPGKQDLVQRWRAARQALAKIHSVDNAIKEGTTDVSAPALAKQANKGAPLSGNLRTIADTANAFPISVRDIGAVRNKVPINALEGIMGTSGLGATVLGEPHLGAGLVAGMIARPIARAGLLSSPFQNSMLPKALSPLDNLLRQQTPRLGIGGLNSYLQNPLLGNQ